jgi:hypothetical protein
MSLSHKLIALAAPVALLGLSGCATPFKADVARFQQMPAPNGQTFTVQTNNPRLEGGLEFAQYASLVAGQLEAKGYQAASSPQTATLVVNVDYGIDNGQEKVVTRPGYGGGFGRPFYGAYRYRSPFYWGWDDPFWYSPFGYPEVDSYTVFTSYLDMTINRTKDGERLFEGKARARSTDSSLPRIVPNLVTAMFTNFPGHSGEEVKISVPPPPKQ